MTKASGVDDFYAFKARSMFGYIIHEHFSFWMICGYLFIEYFRPQAIYPAIDVVPWAQLFILAAFIGLLFDRSAKWVSSPVNFWMILFAIVLWIASLNAYYPEISREHYIDFYSWFVIYFLIIILVNTKERFYIFLMIFLFCSAKIAIGTSLSWAARGFSFTDWGLMGPRGYFQNSGELSILMLTLFPLAFYLFIAFRNRQIRWWEKALLWTFIAAPLITILGASSRGSQIALAVILTLMFRKSIFRIKRLFGIAVLIVVAFFLLPEEQKQRFTEIGEDRTSQQRLLYLQNGWDMMKEYPLLGVGFFNFSEYFSQYYPEDIITVSQSAELPHNIFVQVGTDSGFIGLSIFLMLILTSLRITFNWKDDSRSNDNFFSLSLAGLGYGIIGFAIAGQFVTVAYYPFFWISLAFVVALNNVELKERAVKVVNKRTVRWPGRAL
jgi:putative inorganic carbon (hco3(-)) transporter